MKKINVEATRLNNEDVIATSGTCVGDSRYHLLVQAVNVSYGGGTLERCYLYENGSFPDEVVNYDALPSDVKNSFTDHVSTSYYLDLGTPNEDDTYYWNGTSWVKCNVTHEFPW